MNVEPRPIIAPIPDDNTSEAVMFGPAYKFAKSSKWYLDEVDEYIDQHIKELIDQLENIEWCAYVMRRSPRMVYAREPPVNDPSKIRDLWTLRQIVNFGSARQIVNVQRMTSRLYSTMQGVDQHAKQYIEEGVSEEMWKSSTIGFNVPIEYETIRTIKDMDERLSVDDVEELYAQMDTDERRREADRIESDMHSYMRSFDDSDDSEEPEEEELDIPIYREYDVDDSVDESEDEDFDDEESPDPMSDGFWDDDDEDDLDDDPDDESEDDSDEETIGHSPVIDSVLDIASAFAYDPIDSMLETLESLKAEKDSSPVESEHSRRIRLFRRREAAA